ncbi:glycosylphosphatidylinositol-anchored high density lipoprotein-binding protein 1 [Budorcas taxicolor]|uniref:glycosylphosphatidylinositol-anchored high density lipoprotein-binding protein 1 n=1 Tax=Budorcas taxicolor TaxID=37181 RepID=UPI00228332FB|nr:glycosylphosphatidylinositol-anchored high density lipoprotein-binding protein 1 [Budorcas taxicolor]XP_052507843.1 glycosylphosphatidylinositol-anchored high density lipoprotein-binding protein 1 [Budorcas taxicolor]
MKALAAVLLALLWCRQQGRGQAHEDEDDDPDAGREGYDDEEDEEEEEAGAPVGSRGSGPQCYTCQSLHKGESCEQVQSCVLPRTCKAIVSSWNAESGPQTTYSGWCADTCQAISRTVEGSLTTISCCQSSLCNTPPWQDPQGRGAGGPRGSPATVAATVLLSLLAGLQAMGL